MQVIAFPIQWLVWDDHFRPYLEPCTVEPLFLEEYGDEFSSVFDVNQGPRLYHGETSFSKFQIKARTYGTCSTPFTSTGMFQYKVCNSTTAIGYVNSPSSKSYSNEYASLVGAYPERRIFIGVAWNGTNVLWYRVDFAMRKSDRLRYIVADAKAWFRPKSSSDLSKEWANAAKYFNSHPCSHSVNPGDFPLNYQTVTVTSGDTVSEIWKRSDSVSRLLGLAMEQFPIEKLRAVQGEALLNVVDKCQATDVVNLENVVQLIDVLRDPFSGIADLQRLVKQPKNLKEFLRKVADAKLTYDYSIKTTLSDIAEAQAVLSKPRALESIARGRHSDVFNTTIGDYHYTCSIEHAYKVYYGSVDESTIPMYRALQNVGLDPSFEHVWNLIPYSFVVDWLLPTGKMWQMADYDTNVATLPVHAVTHGYWERWTVVKQAFIAEISAYNRTVTDELPAFPYFLPSMTPDMNWWNGAALLVQRLR